MTKLLAARVLLAAALFGLDMPSAAAQTGASTSSDDVAIEFTGFGGATGGFAATPLTAAFAQGLRLGGIRNVSTERGSSTKWLLGGGVGIGVTSRVLVTFDGSMNRIASPSFSGTAVGRPVSISMRATLFEYVGGVQYLLAKANVEPYLAAGIGVARLRVSANATNVGVDTSATESDVVSNFGGGVRLYVGSSWGIRPDVRVVRLPGETFLRANVAVFSQLR